MQKIFLFICCIFLMTKAVIAQGPDVAEIKKLKIKKITVYYGEKRKEGTTVTSLYFDVNGHDTVSYAGKKRVSYNTIEYDKKQQPLTINSFSNDGVQNSKTIFTYKPDGSYTVVNTDLLLGLKTTDVYDKKGLQLTHTVPDGTVYRYVYNTKKQLTKYYSIPRKGGVKFTKEYTYNAIGQITGSVNKGDYPFTSVYEYDSKGLLKKIISTSVNESGQKVSAVQYYEYDY